MFCHALYLFWVGLKNPIHEQHASSKASQAAFYWHFGFILLSSISSGVEITLIAIHIAPGGIDITVNLLMTVLVINTVCEIVNYLFILRVAYKLNIYYEQYREKVERDASARHISDNEYIETRMNNIFGNHTSEATSWHHPSVATTSNFVPDDYDAHLLKLRTDSDELLPKDNSPYILTDGAGSKNSLNSNSNDRHAKTADRLVEDKNGKNKQMNMVFSRPSERYVKNPGKSQFPKNSLSQTHGAARYW